MARYEVRVTGDKELLRAMQGMANKIPHAVAMALYEEANRIFIEAQLLTPIDTGALRGSGFVTQPKVDSNKAKVSIQYGGAAAPYALYVHERIDAPSGNPVYHRPPTQAKFLSIPVDRAIPTLGSNLLQRISHIFRGR
jgi:hypothetical protein